MSPPHLDHVIFPNLPNLYVLYRQQPVVIFENFDEFYIQEHKSQRNEIIYGLISVNRDS